ncbi:MAG: hypothetical protein DMG06_25890 [Acidobacteria bacterium]|nr:MAG: hypothetical protein DMG06_25890 [Acidobacteriota bacterium]
MGEPLETSYSMGFVLTTMENSSLIQGLVKSRTLPHGRATEQAQAQLSSPRVSNGCASTYHSRTLTGPCLQSLNDCKPVLFVV